MLRENFFSLLISSAVLVINSLIPLLLFCWKRVNEYCPFWLLHIHFPCKLCHKPYNYSSDLSTNSSNCGNRQQDIFFPLAFLAVEPPLLPCHCWGSSLFLLGSTLAQRCSSSGCWSSSCPLSSASPGESQPCSLPWRGELGKTPRDGCPPAAGMGEMWGWDYHGFTSAGPSLLEAGAVGAVPLSHTGLHSSGTALQKGLVSLVCMHRGEGCLKEHFRHNIWVSWCLSRGRWVLQVLYPQEALA